MFGVLAFLADAAGGRLAVCLMLLLLCFCEYTGSHRSRLSVVSDDVLYNEG